MPNPDSYEILGLVGSISKIPRRVVAFMIYIPPSTRAGDLTKIRDALSEEIAAAKVSYKNPMILIGGDFNPRDISSYLGDTEPLAPIPTGPTRGDGVLDVVFTNFGEHVQESKVVPPPASKKWNGKRS